MAELIYQSGFGNSFATEALARRAAGRPQLAAALPLRPVRRAALRHGLHRAARRQPALLAVPHPPVGDAHAVQAHRAGRIVSRFGSTDEAPTPPNQLRWNPLADAHRADRLRRGPGDHGRQRRCARAGRRRRICTLVTVDDTARVLQRRWRDAVRAAARAAPLRHRARRDRAGPQEIVVIPRGFASASSCPMASARLRLRELRRQLSACPTSARSARTAWPIRATS
jgi:hypothetical protein